MNKLQIGLFMVYSISLFISGIGLYGILNKGAKGIMSRAIYLGESLLLGGLFLVGELLILSFLGLYKAPYLWAVVILNYAYLFKRSTREGLMSFAKEKITIDLPLMGFILLLLVFMYRNCYCMVDVDSLFGYLFTQKVWLASGTSLVGGPTYNSMLYVPQFDVLPSALGISLFAQETLFPQLINVFWRVIVLILLFGYTSYRFNRYCGLAAAIFVALNDHFFFSGVNRWVLINGAVIAFMFASAYNFWEARQQNSTFRFLLALIFLSQMLANKMQVISIFIFLLIIGVAIQKDVIKKIKEIFSNKLWVSFIIASLVFVFLWYFKNFLITGNFVFPRFAGKLATFGYTLEQEQLYSKLVSGIGPGLFLKYMSYLFIWPGINAAKIVIFTISFLPIFLFLLYVKNKEDKKQLIELFFWLGLCVLAVMGMSLVSHWEPRYHRYPIAIMAFTAVLSVRFIFMSIGLRNKFIIGLVMLLIALKGSVNEGYKLIFSHGDTFVRPSMRENTDIILDRIHTDYAVRKVCPEIDAINSSLRENNDKINSAAWELSFSYPLFLLPVRPQISPMLSATIKWDSYNSPEAVMSDLKRQGIDWVMQMRDGKLIFITALEYSREAGKFNKHPSQRIGNYGGLPPELIDIRW